MRFTRPGGGALVLGEATLAVLATHTQHAPAAPEAGGVLLGRLIAGTDDVIVDAATVPGRADRRGRFFFWRARRPAQLAVDAAWAASDGTRVYLGEWHTHPQDDPAPSEIDVADWRHLARDARFEQGALFFIIAGRVRMRAWEVARGTGVVVALAGDTDEAASNAGPSSAR